MPTINKMNSAGWRSASNHWLNVTTTRLIRESLDKHNQKFVPITNKSLYLHQNQSNQWNIIRRK